ncbi:hypothetical protein [Kingella pumchi]|uniref:Uncharacterized protein n=1 Tax=Kingella pumchi TaxID=2779506 RepID=A0ABS9NPH8_9NEIS|nr:hypothetical protein [Kingella pumchi]MCG6504703.1 hypothetical protein [Kingella pumchi]
MEHLGRYWQQHPPAHLLIAQYVGYQAAEPQQQMDADEAIGAMGGAVLSEAEFDALLREKGIIT